MASRKVRFEPYYLDNPEDERIPMAVAGYAAALKPGFVLDMTHVSHAGDGDGDYVRNWGARIGGDEGVAISYRQTLSPDTGNPTSMRVEVAGFGLPEGCGVSIRYEARWEKGNRSFIELEAEGPERELEKIEKAFRKEFAPPTGRELDRLEAEMNKALERQAWGSMQDYAEQLLLWRPDDPEALLGMSTALIMSRNLDAAERCLTRLLELRPDYYQAHLNMGTVWMDRDEYDKAIEEYQAMADLKPNDSFAPFILATAYEARGDTARALELYMRASRMKGSPGPTDYQALSTEAIERLSQA